MLIVPGTRTNSARCTYVHTCIHTDAFTRWGDCTYVCTRDPRYRVLAAGRAASSRLASHTVLYSRNIENNAILLLRTSKMHTGVFLSLRDEHHSAHPRAPLKNRTWRFYAQTRLAIIVAHVFPEARTEKELLER